MGFRTEPTIGAIARRVASFLLLLAATAPAQETARGRRLAEAAEEAQGRDATLALLLAREAVRAGGGAAARTALYDGLVSVRERAVYRGHEGAVVHVAISPDGTEVLTASEDGTCRVWSRAGRPLQRLECSAPVRRAVYWGGGDRILAETEGRLLLFSRAGRLLASIPARRHQLAGQTLLAVPEEGKAVLWGRDGARRKELEADLAVLAPSGTRLCTRDRRGTVKLWTGAGDAVATLPHGTPPAFLLFDAAGEVLVTGGGETLRVWNARGERMAKLSARGSVVRAVLAPGGDRLVTTTAGGRLTVWDLRRAAPVLQAQRKVDEVIFLPDGTFYTISGNVVDGWRGTRQFTRATFAEPPVDLRPLGTRLRVAYRDRRVEVRERNLRPTRGIHRPAFVRSGPRGRWILTGDGSKAVLHREARRIELRGHTGAVVAGCFAPDGRHVLTASRDGTARLWAVDSAAIPRLEAGRPLSSCGMPWVKETVYTLAQSSLGIWRTDGTRVADLAHASGIAWWAYSPGSATVAIVPRDAVEAFLYDVDGKLVAKLPHNVTVKGVWMTRKGESLLTWDGHKVKLWDGAGRLERTIAHKNPIAFAKPGPAGEHVYTGTIEGRARIWRRDGTLRAEWIPPEPIHRMRWAPDGKTFLSRSATSPTVRYWDLDGEQLAELEGHDQPPTRIRFSRAGDLLLTCGRDGRAILWNLRGSLLTVLAHPAAVSYASFLPGDRRIVTTCHDGVARIWTRRGDLVAELAGHEAAVTLASCDERGDRLVTCSKDATARVWPLALDDLLRLADESLCRGFRAEERQRYAALLK